MTNVSASNMLPASYGLSKPALGAYYQVETKFLDVPE